MLTLKIVAQEPTSGCIGFVYKSDNMYFGRIENKHVTEFMKTYFPTLNYSDPYRVFYNSSENQIQLFPISQEALNTLVQSVIRNFFAFKTSL